MPQTRQSSVLSLEAEGSDDSDSSDDDIPLAERLANLAQARKDREKDAAFLTDGDGDESEDSTDSYGDEEDAGAVSEPEPAPAPPENERAKRTACGRKSQAKRDKMALKRRVGETNKGDPPEFDPCRVGLYYALSKRDLTHSQWVEACLFMHQEMNTFSGGYERGDEEENLHGQFQGTARIPPTTKGCDAFKAVMKEYLDIQPHSGVKIQVKLLNESAQPDEKMNAYCMKDKPKPWFQYDSKDVNGEPYTEEYNDYCIDKYKVTLHSISPYCLIRFCAD
jgi:hypothetical protein